MNEWMGDVEETSSKVLIELKEKYEQIRLLSRAKILRGEREEIEFDRVRVRWDACFVLIVRWISAWSDFALDEVRQELISVK